MGGQDQLTSLQLDAARIFFELESSREYLVVRGAALLATGLIKRPTGDLDLFASAPVTTVVEAKHDFVRALEARGLEVVLIQEAETFCRMIIASDDDQVLVDLAIDAPPSMSPTLTVLGPTLAAEELAVRKLLALFNRAEARDFADVYVLTQQFDRAALTRQAAEQDAGFDLGVLSQMFTTMGRFADDEIPLRSAEVPHAREFFSAWSAEIDQQTG